MKRFMVIMGIFVLLSSCAAMMLLLTSHDYVLIDRMLICKEAAVTAFPDEGVPVYGH
jgi:hypothetical protein